jgi:hypothetical protein
VAQTVGDISQYQYLKTSDPNWDEGGAYKTLLQAAGAALVAQLGNGEGLSAALGTAAGQLTAGTLEEFAQSIANNLSEDPDVRNLLTNILTNAASTAVGLAAGGESGGALASSMDRYNRQLHPFEKAKILELAGQFAEEAGISEEEALQRLVEQVFLNLDTLQGLGLANDALAAAFLEANSGDFTVDGVDNQYFKTLTFEEKDNHAIFAEHIWENRDFYDRLPLVVGMDGAASPSVLAILEAAQDRQNMLNQDASNIQKIRDDIHKFEELNSQKYLSGEISEEVYKTNISRLRGAANYLNQVMYNIPELEHLVTSADLAAHAVAVENAYGEMGAYALADLIGNEEFAVILAAAISIKRAKAGLSTQSASVNNKPQGNQYVSLIDEKAKIHILDGDGFNSGGHRSGTGKSGKSEFPPSWSDEKILHNISDIATDPSLRWSAPQGRNGYVTVTGTREGIDIKVVYDPKLGRVVTGYPTNTPRNP